jgi:UDP-GlcNAc3NAcA epimerase
MKIVTVVGARPQFVKAAVLSNTFAHQGSITELIVHTGQHYDSALSSIFFEEMGIPDPSHNLNVGSGPHGYQTGEMLAKIEAVLIAEWPHVVLVYGDTNSTLAGALAGVKLGIPVAHIEAGLRSYNRQMPEEINRVLTDHASELLFAPTLTAAANLSQEGIPASRVHLTGDVMFDAVKQYGPAARNRKILPALALEPKKYVLATIHRAENTDNTDRLTTVFTALAKVSSKVRVVMPLHPRTRNALNHLGLSKEAPNTLTIIDPVGYLDMLALEAGASVIVTDSGGVQKEACFCGVPCVTVRDETEWPELVDAGWNTLAPPRNQDSVACAVLASVGTRGTETVGFGDGTAGTKIANILQAFLDHAGPPRRSIRKTAIPR